VATQQPSGEPPVRAAEVVGALSLATDVGTGRKLHGSKGSTVYSDPNEEGRVWAIFNWDLEGWQRFASDPEVPAIMQEAGHQGRPQVPELVGRYNA
jgi:hypothetical protein